MDSPPPEADALVADSEPPLAEPGDEPPELAAADEGGVALEPGAFVPGGGGGGVDVVGTGTDAVPAGVETVVVVVGSAGGGGSGGGGGSVGGGGTVVATVVGSEGTEICAGPELCPSA